MLNNVKSTVKNSVIYGLGNLSTKIVGFILLPLYTDHLSTTDYGILGMIEITSTAIITIFSLSLYQAFFRWYWQKDMVDKQKSLFYTFTIATFFMVLLMVIVLMPLIYTNLLSLMLFHQAGLNKLLLLMTISASLEIINQSPNTLIRLKEKPILFSTANLIKLTISLLLNIYFIVYLHMKVEGIYTALIIGQLVYLAFLSKFILKNITPIFEWKALKEMLLFSLPLTLSASSVIGLNLADRYVLSILGELSDVGIYSLGYKMANTIQIFIVTSVNLAVSPMLFKMMDSPNKDRFYTKIMTYYIFGLMFFIMGMSLFGKEVIKVMARGDMAYWDAYKIIPLLSFSIGFMALRDIALTGLYLKKKTVVIARTIVLISILNIGLNFFFIHFFKTMGGAIASCLSQFIYFLIILNLAQKAYFIPYELKKIGLIIFIGASLVFLASIFNDFSTLVRIIVKSLAIAAYPIILFWLKFYEEAELTAIQGFWIKWRNPLRWKENISNFKFNL